jgi:hypothetical protein
MMLAEINIFHAQAQTFEQAYSCTIKQPGLRAKGRLFALFQHETNFGLGQHHGQPFIFFGAQGIDTGQFDVQHLPVKKEARSRSGRGRSEVVALVREVVRVTSVRRLAQQRVLRNSGRNR